MPLWSSRRVCTSLSRLGQASVATAFAPRGRYGDTCLIIAVLGSYWWLLSERLSSREVASATRELSVVVQGLRFAVRWRRH